MKSAPYFLILTFVVLSFGCQNQNSLDGLVPVQGIVTHNGEALSGAAILFHPKDGGRPAASTSKEEGKFVLTTMRHGDGIAPGVYFVTVKKTEIVGAMTDEEEVAYIDKNGREPPAPERRNLLPEKYSDIGTSELTFTISDDGEKDLKIELKD